LEVEVEGLGCSLHVCLKAMGGRPVHDECATYPEDVDLAVEE
jgi:hypothetical protein